MMCPAQGQKCPWVEVCVSPVCALRGWRSLHTRVVVNVSFSSLFSYSSLLSCLPFIPFHTVSVILSHILLILFFISVPHSFSCSPFSFPSSPSLSLYPHLSFLFSPFNSTPLSFSLRPSLCPTLSFLPHKKHADTDLWHSSFLSPPSYSCLPACAGATGFPGPSSSKPLSSLHLHDCHKNHSPSPPIKPRHSVAPLLGVVLFTPPLLLPTMHRYTSFRG